MCGAPFPALSTAPQTDDPPGASTPYSEHSSNTTTPDPNTPGQLQVLRVFEAPRAFLASLAAATGSRAAAAAADTSAGDGTGALGAAMPALGLSNRALYDGYDEAGSGQEQEAVDGGHRPPTNPAGGGGRGGASSQYEAGPDIAPCAAPRVVDGARHWNPLNPDHPHHETPTNPPT